MDASLVGVEFKCVQIKSQVQGWATMWEGVAGKLLHRNKYRKKNEIFLKPFDQNSCIFCGSKIKFLKIMIPEI